MMAEYTYIGKSVPRIDARDKVTGETIYSSDIQLPGMLIGKCKRSPVPFAKIVSIDISKALKLHGVRVVITAHNVIQFNYGEFAFDQFPLCKQYAHYVGDEVAAVAAIDKDTAEEAIDVIEVEYEVLTPVFDPEEAMGLGAPAVHPELEGVEQNIASQIDFERGDGDRAFKQADVVLEERFTTQPVHHCYLQDRDCVAVWHGDKLTLWAVMQSPFRMRIPIARSLGIPEDHIRIIPCSVGGGFGNNAYSIWPIAALLAKKANKPVKIALTREEEIIDLRMGFKKNGTIIAKKTDIIADTGAYIGSCRGVLTTSASRADNMYYIPNIKTSAKLVYTNNIPRGSLRGYGTQVGTFPLESMIDMAAEEFGIDPAEIRLKNASQKGDTTIHGWILNSCGFRETIQLAGEKSGWNEYRNKKGKTCGIGMACATHVAGNRNVMRVFDGSAAMVRVDEQGKVRVISGEVDIGQGSETVFTQIAAEELGVSIEDVKVLSVDTDVSPFAMGTFADRVTVLGGSAVRMAAKDARRQLFGHAAEILETNPEDMELKDGKFYVKGSPEAIATLQEIARQVVLKRGGFPIMGKGEYVVPDHVVVSDEKTQYGNYSLAYTFLTQVAEVSVDPETGKADVLNIWSAIDLGKAINPKACESQVEGGVMMGIGFALTEDYIVKDGRMLNPNFTDYRVPSFSNVPRMYSFFIETVDPATPFGAKSVGEAIGDPTAAAIANAIYNAIGVRLKELPMTPEKILNALREKNKQ
jgi:CO/xanthine dehydrogenase Mo-binding subunit